MLARLWMFLSGASSAWALISAVNRDWVSLGIFIFGAVGSLVVVWRGYFGVAEDSLCRHNNRVADGTASFRRAHLEIVKGGQHGR